MISVLDPLADTRWDELLERHPRASVFHSRGWLEALKRTYGYEPLVLTTTAQGPLENGLAFCRVSTWASRRLVSLPFSDHCERASRSARRPVRDAGVSGGGDGEGSLALAGTAASARRTHWSCEGRQLLPAHRGSRAARGADLRGFHASSTQRAIRRAEREGLSYEAGRSESLLSSFYRLLRLTRRRHGLPPQPLAWFRNLAACLGDGLTIHVASKDGVAIAAILTLTFKKTVVYKYGGSDAERHPLGGMPFLFWRAIQHAQAEGVEELDLGRSDLDQPGLIAFKDHLGATRSTLTYYCRPERRAGPARDGLLARASRWVVGHLPDAALDLTGRLLYRHLG